MQKEQLGQHFLINKEILKRIRTEININPQDVVLEIGTGHAELTLILMKTQAKKIISVELDYKLKADIEKNLDVKDKQLEIIYGNALDVAHEEEYTKIVSNLPYYICEPLFKIILKKMPVLCVFLVGKKFWELLNTQSKTGIAIRSAYNLQKISDVSRAEFRPVPHTESVLFKMIKKESINEQDALIKEIFQQDDKLVPKALRCALKRVKKMTGKKAGKKVKEIISGKHENLAKKRVNHLSNVQVKQLLEIIENLKTN